MNFKEALIAHLQGEKVEAFASDTSDWIDFGKCFDGLSLGYLKSINHSSTKFRLAPRTIFVNGVEVPAPESVAPECGAEYFLPNYGYSDCLYDDLTWAGHEFNFKALERGLVYLNKEDAIARAKAMLLCK